METIDCTPTWSAIVGLLITVLEHGNEEGKKQAREELKRMAEIADRFVELEKKAEIPTVPTNRQLAIHWWLGLATSLKHKLTMEHMGERHPESLTGREIESIYDKVKP